ncbi:MAG: hypothetical protein ACLQLC_10350 [Candidatus Sulfotelmatobacter sp.]
MSVRNAFVLLLALSTLSLLVGCGSSNNIAKAVAPPSGSFSDSNLNGTYVFSISGIDQSGYAYAAAGTLTANGSGGITGGTIDMNDAEFTAPVAGAPINNNSTYSVTQDGRGSATIGLPSADNPFGQNLSFDFVLQDSSHGLIIEFDGNATGSGTLDSQTSSVTPVGTYAFSFSGASFSSDSPIATAGNFTIGSGGALTGVQDFNEDGQIAYTDETLSGTFTLGPSTTPATTLTTAAFNTLTFDVYAIDATHLKFIEMDTFATLSGDAFTQSSSATLPTGTLAFTLAGIYPSSTPFAAGGFMVTDGSGNITSASSEDYNEGGSLSSAPGPFTANYSASGTGRYTLTNFATFVPSGSPTFAAYPYSNGSLQGILLLEIDTLGITTGAAYLQNSGATFASSQGYALNFTGTSSANESEVEVDDIAEFTATSSGAVTGVDDENYAPGGGPNYGLALDNGTYGNGASSGRNLISAATGNSNNSTVNGGYNLTLYTVDGTTFPFIEMDSGEVSSGVIVEQNASASGAAMRHLFATPPILRPHAANKKKN